jgi:hypothetical protein
MDKVSKIINAMRMRTAGPVQTVKSWREMLPPGSRWNPGDPGDPNCKVCDGTGFVRLDLPVNHPQFGKVHYCDCVNDEKLQRMRSNL